MYNRLSKLKDSLITPKEGASQIEAKIAVQHAAGALDDPDGWRAAARAYADYQRTWGRLGIRVKGGYKA